MTSASDNEQSPPGLADLQDFIAAIARQMSEHGLASVKVQSHGVDIRLTSKPSRRKVGDGIEDAMPIGLPPAPSAQPSDLDEGGNDLLAPMIGTFYAAPSPSDPPYVEVGDAVEIGQVVGIIEAMKILNEITADREGTIEEIYVKNAQAVEYGQSLMRIA